MEDQEIVKEFLIESNDNLSRLEQEMVELERRPRDTELLASVFRTFHTIKGTCGFLGYGKLERVAHQAENVLSQLRSGSQTFTSGLASLVLEAVDVLRRHLRAIERSRKPRHRQRWRRPRKRSRAVSQTQPSASTCTCWTNS